MDNSQVNIADDVDSVFFWRLEGENTPNKCRIRIYWITWEKALLIVTELADNRGAKIASATPELIRLLGELYDLVANKMMLIEHYPARNSPKSDTYLQVMLVNNEAIRYELDKEHLEALIGKTI